MATYLSAKEHQCLSSMSVLSGIWIAVSSSRDEDKTGISDIKNLRYGTPPFETLCLRWNKHNNINSTATGNTTTFYTYVSERNKLSFNKYTIKLNCSWNY